MEAMNRTAPKIAALLSSRGSAANGQDETAWRTTQLEEALTDVRDESVDGLAEVVQQLADGARDQTWRLPIGDSGLLRFILSVVAAGQQDPRHPLIKQTLRFIANACADCDENRAKVVESGCIHGFLIDCLKHDAVLPFAIAAILNVCVDYDKAQLQASEAGLSKILVDIVSGERLSSCQASLSHIMTILELLCNQDTEPKLANPNTPALLLGLATSDRYHADLNAFLEICTPALAYLTFQDFQPVLLETGNFELLQLAFDQLYRRFGITEVDTDTVNQLKQVGNTFVAIFADISALPSFSSVCSLNSKATRTLIEWLRQAPDFPQLQTAACLSLGNLSRSDESSTALLEHVKDSLCSILYRAIPPLPSAPSPSPNIAPPLQLTHASLSFLKNLAIPTANKDLLGAALLDPFNPLLPRLWGSTRTQPQLQFAATSLARLLLVNCPSNIRRICTPLGGEGQSSSSLALLTSTAFSADEEPIKMEAARAVSLVCRALHSSEPASSEILDPSWTWALPSTSSESTATPALTSAPSQSSPSNPQSKPQTRADARARFYAAHSEMITTALTLLLTQTRFPPVRSGAVFVLALMSHTSAAGGGHGAHMALRVLQSGGGDRAWRALAEMITGSAELPDEGAAAEETGREQNDDDGVAMLVTGAEELSLMPPQQQQQQQPTGKPAEMDRENAMVLIAELLRNFPDELGGMKTRLEAVLAIGGKLVAQARNGDQEQKTAA